MRANWPINKSIMLGMGEGQEECGPKDHGGWINNIQHQTKSTQLSPKHQDRNRWRENQVDFARGRDPDLTANITKKKALM